MSLTDEIVGIIIQTLSLFIFLKLLLNDNIKIISISVFASFLFLMFITYITYEINYTGLQTISSFIAIIIAVSFVTKYSLLKSLIISATYILTMFIADFINLSIMVKFIDINELRTKYFPISNLFVSILTILIIMIPQIKNNCSKFVNVIPNKKKLEICIFVILFVIGVTIILFIISKNYYLNKNFVLFIIGGFLFILMALIYFKEKYDKEKIVDRYDHLFEYVQTFEEWIDVESINIHESKNQLATLREMIKGNKKAEKYIDDIINERMNIENACIENLKPIPKGGLKGLLYYKINVAQKNDINIEINISKNVNKILKTFTNENNKDLCRLLGIFLDNAIEASKESIDKKIMLEIYLLKDDLCIVISNTFENNVDLSKTNQKGYTTKGKNRGKGLYLSKKISEQIPQISLKTQIINNYYIQTINIKK